MADVTYKITITRTSIEQGEIGRRYERTGRKLEDGADEWGYTPSVIGPKETERTILTQVVEHEIDIPALQRLVNRGRKEVSVK